jgi:xylan 1,4-beta-xylosidase
VQWNFFGPAPDEITRVRRSNGTLVLNGAGKQPSDSLPLVFIAPDLAYEFECDIEVDENTQAGMLLFYDHKLYCGLGFDARQFTMHRYGIEHGQIPQAFGRRLRFRNRNYRHVVSIHTSVDGVTWQRGPRGLEVSGYHHNVRGGFMALKPALYAAGKGEVRFRGFRYRGLG